MQGRPCGAHSKSAHALLERGLFQNVRVFPVGDDLLQSRRNFHDLVYADSAFISTVAGAAADRIVQYNVRSLRADAHRSLFFFGCVTCLSALRAEPANQSLCDNAYHGVRNQVTFYAHIKKSGNRCSGTVRMECAYYQVTGDGCLYGNLCSLAVSNLTDHDNVRVLTEYRSKRGSKGKSRLNIYMYLVDSVDVRLNRVLNRDNVNVFFIQFT